jgi:hypothetical protein
MPVFIEYDSEVNLHQKRRFTIASLSAQADTLISALLYLKNVSQIRTISKRAIRRVTRNRDHYQKNPFCPDFRVYRKPT